MYFLIKIKYLVGTSVLLAETCHDPEISRNGIERVGITLIGNGVQGIQSTADYFSIDDID